jgi:hypothetical protein
MKRDTKGRPAKKAAPKPAKPKTGTKPKAKPKPKPTGIPGDAAINAQIAALEEIKPRVRHYSSFGDNHHYAIEAQVRVLTDRMRPDRALGFFAGCPDNVQDAVSDVVDWLEGEAPAPVESWKELVR